MVEHGRLIHRHLIAVEHRGGHLLQQLLAKVRALPPRAVVRALPPRSHAQPLSARAAALAKRLVALTAARAAHVVRAHVAHLVRVRVRVRVRGRGRGRRRGRGMVMVRVRVRG